MSMDAILPFGIDYKKIPKVLTFSKAINIGYFFAFCFL